jgi:hypothetical protein
MSISYYDAHHGCVQAGIALRRSDQKIVECGLGAKCGSPDVFMGVAAAI